MNSLPPAIASVARDLEARDAEAIVAVFDEFGHYLYASPNHQDALGYTQAELELMHLSDVVEKAEHRAAYVLRTIIVFYSRPIRFSSHLVSKAGELVEVSGTLRHTRDQGTMYFLTSVRVV
jgi:PAS domain S-box-containing protein